MEFKIGDKVRFKGGTDVWKVTGLYQHQLEAKFISDDIKTINLFDVKNLELVGRPKQKKLVPHWPALCNNGSGYYLADYIFKSEDGAKKIYDTNFVRLANELPPIMIEVEEE